MYLHGPRQFLTANDFDSATSERISIAIEKTCRIYRANVDILQNISYDQIDSSLKYELNPDDFEQFKKFHYMYLIYYNRDLKRGVLQQIVDGTVEVPLQSWHNANEAKIEARRYIVPR
jgi:hypothetical protein